MAFPSGNAVEQPRAQRLRVLVIDDSPTVRQQLTIAFERMGMACETAANAQAALARLAQQHFDLALVDVIMPEMDGYKLTREIKRNKRTRQVPVIILTSKSSPFDLARGALAGCDSFLSKPVPLKALEAAVVKHLRKSLAIDDLSSLLRPLSASAPAASDPSRSGAAHPGRSARKP
ncbi:MAG TPA: response regulator [Burkholderiaceae bacterium]|nr:response regulator [Burkholderiaceae bacterium]